ncbi:MAG: uroporphyrinogen decarboxylase family protein [Candidatus Oleimicrobiaceae bacterium]
MTSKQRVLSALEHREADRIPKFELCVNSPVGSKVLGREAWVGTGGYVMGKLRNEMILAGRRREFYQRFIEDTIELYRTLGYDILVIDPYESEHDVKPKKVGDNEWRYEIGEGYWALMRYLPEEDLYYEVDSSLRHEGIAGFRAMVKAMDKRGPSPIRPDDTMFEALDYAIANASDMFVLGHYDVFLPTFSTWLPVFLEAMVTDPGLVKTYLDIVHENNFPLLIAQLERGVDGIDGRMDFCGKNGPMFSPQHFEQFVKPYLEQITATCHRYGKPFIKHLDGNFKPIERQIIMECGFDGIHSIEPVAGMDIGELKRKYGQHITLCGNVDCAELLSYGTPSQVKEATRQVIRIAAPGGGFVLASSNCIHSQVPVKNLMAMLEAAEEYGTYPINV